MHELSIAKELFEVIQNTVKDKSLRQVSKIVIKLGVASGFEESFLRHSLVEHLFSGTILEKAELEIVSIPISVKCQDCKTVFDSADSLSGLNCSVCKGMNLDIISGKEVYVESIEGEM